MHPKKTEHQDSAKAFGEQKGALKNNDEKYSANLEELLLWCELEVSDHLNR